MGEIIPFVTKEEADRVAYAVGVIEWVTEKVLKGELDFTDGQESKIAEATEVLNQYSTEELLIFFNRPQEGDKE
ncbi:hypothetical protein [Bacillus atrophaeus]|uniref:hypothetical protein n=1 Tax=Bacillus atrophaeus TaxID=1452 RepID=UPI002E229056|nr:hypothetical protein [Bacillus atrophaeus]